MPKKVYRIVWRQLKEQYRKKGIGSDEQHERWASTIADRDDIMEAVARMPGITKMPKWTAHEHTEWRK